MSSTHAEERLDDMLLRSSSVSTSLLLVKSFSLLPINAVEGNLSVEPLLLWPPVPEGEGVVADELEAPDEDIVVFVLLLRSLLQLRSLLHMPLEHNCGKSKLTTDWRVLY